MKVLATYDGVSVVEMSNATYRALSRYDGSGSRDPVPGERIREENMLGEIQERDEIIQRIRELPELAAKAGIT
jgi:hypothetical protein